MRILSALGGLLCVLSATGALAAPATLYADNPLVGTLWDTRSGKQAGEDALLAEAARVEWVLLGEKHDNAAHHRLQAEVVGALGRAGRRMAVVWEMAEPAQAEALRSARLETVGELGRALDWEARGWPDWRDYQPIAKQALRYGLPMRPGKPSREMVRRIARGEPPDAQTAARIGWSRRYTPAQDADLRRELAASHCGALPDSVLPAMVRVQRFWDAWMAAAHVEAAAGRDGAILIAGTGHVRRDRAVPWHLEGQGKSLVVAFVEVAHGHDDPRAYPAFDARLYDFVWFTAAVDTGDPCAAFGLKTKD